MIEHGIGLARARRVIKTQMQDGLVSGVQPVAEFVEWRTLTNLEPHNLAIESAEFLEQLARPAKIVVIEASYRH